MNLPIAPNQAMSSVEARTWIGGDSSSAKIRWTVRPNDPSLADLNLRLAAKHDRLLETSKRNTKRLTGRDRI